MGKNYGSEEVSAFGADATATKDAADFPVTLEEFCTRLSATDRRVELIGGFDHSEKAAKRTKDTEAAYRARFIAFCTAPA